MKIIVRLILSFAAIVSIVTVIESCTFTADSIKGEMGPISVELKNVTLDVGASVIKKAMEDHPDKATEIITEICEMIETYRALAENYKTVVEGLKGVPNSEGTQKSLSDLAKSFDETADGYEELLNKYDVDCREYLSN